MTIHPKDLKRLIVRVVAVTVALRAVHLFSVDLNALEVAAAWALPAEGHAVAPLHLLIAAWREVCGGVAGLLRAPTLIADAALPLLAIAYARASGWGTLSGLMAGLVLAVAPLGLDDGWRADGSTLIAALAFAGLWQLRLGLRRGKVLAVALSVLCWAAALGLNPVALVVTPAALWLIARSVAMPQVKAVAAAGWLLSALAGWALGGGASLDLASAWIQDSALNGGRVIWTGSVTDLFAVARAWGPAGASGAVATLFDTAAAPSWRLWLGDAVMIAAAVGLLIGRVQEDPSPAAAEQDSGWKSVGVTHNTAPRVLGERDWAPLLLPPLTTLAWAWWTPDVAGVADALAVARPFVAVLIGLGLTALCLKPWGAEELASAKRAVPSLVALALLLFGFGAHHTWVGTQRPSRMAPGKVARFVASYTADSGQVLCLGLGGLEIAWRLGPWPTLPRVSRTPSEPVSAQAALDESLRKRPKWLALAGDKWALESPSLGGALSASLSKRGYTLVEDGHRHLDRLGVLVLEFGGQEPAPSAVRPQLYPGKAP